MLPIRVRAMIMAAPRVVGRISGCASIIAIVCVAAACGGSSSGKKQTSLIFGASDGRIIEYDLASDTSKGLAQSPPGSNTYLRDPSVSPDGLRIAYIWAPPVKVRDGKQDASNDVWVANRDGSDAHQAYQHVDYNETLYSSVWEDDDHVLVAARILPSRASLAGAVYRLLRIDIAAGTAEVALEQVNTFGIRESEVAFSRVAVAGEAVEESLNIAGTDGSEMRVLLPPEQELAFFGTPRISPDGKRVAFIALTRQQALSPKQPGENAPAELWTIDTTGENAAKVTEFDAREGMPPGIAWRSDGKHIYVAGEAGVFDVDLATGFADRRSDTRASGMLAVASSP